MGAHPGGRLPGHRLLAGVRQFKGHENSNLLLDACVKDSREKGKKGLSFYPPQKSWDFCPTRSSCAIAVTGIAQVA